MKQCKHCPEPVEAERYEMCKECWWSRDPRNIKNGGTVDLEPKKQVQRTRKTVKTSFNVPTPVQQKLEISCVYYKEWDVHLVNLYTYDVYPKRADYKPIAEELTLRVKSKAEIEKIINTLREVTQRLP